MITFIFFLVLSFEGFGQGLILDSLVAQFNHYQHKRIQEKIFVHTDKNFYVAGEIIWFKLYTVEASSQQLSELSKVAYLEVFSKDQKPVLQGKISLKEGTGNGSFYLPLTLNSGNYKVRAYTHWMRNFSQDYFFEKDITIVNTFKAPDIINPVSKSGYTIQFFPEGGNLVESIESKIAFKIVDEHGKGIDGKGFILDQHDDTLVRFKAVKFGMGHFSFLPQVAQTYKAFIQIANGSPITVNLPSVYSQGYVIRLEDTGVDVVKITALMSKNSSSHSSSKVYLFAHSRQQMQVAEMQTLTDGKAEFLIKKDKLGEGVSHFTLFNEARQPVCERLFFKRPEHKMQIQVKASQESFISRKKVNLDILTTDQLQQPQLANISLSVYLQDSLQVADTFDMHSYLWLTSELNGHIESLEYYLKKPSPEADQALDNLMLTHGWRRFRWEDVLQEKIPSFEFLPEHTGHIITGSITDTRSGKAAGNIALYLTVPGKRIQFYTSRSDAKGNFKFNTKELFGYSQVHVQTNPQVDSLYRIEISNPFAQDFSPGAFPPFSLAGNLHHSLLNKSISMQVQNAFAEEKRNRFHSPQVDSTVFYFSPDRKYLLDDFTRFPTVEEVVREYVPEVAVRKRKGKLHFLVFDKRNDLFFETDPLVLLDGLPVFDNQKIFAFNPLKIKKLEVISSRYILGPLAFNGILNFSTYTNDMAGFEINPATVVLAYEGLQLQREFYSPVYETEEQLKNRLPDLRNMLYWDPAIFTDVNGKKQISFYTSDMSGTFIGVIHGISKNGLSGSQTFTFEVKRQL